MIFDFRDWLDSPFFPKPSERQVVGIVRRNGRRRGLLRRRLLDMGLTPKTKVMVRKVAPMGDPIELYLRGYVLTIRAEDAAKIEIEEDSVQ